MAAERRPVALALPLLLLALGCGKDVPEVTPEVASQEAAESAPPVTPPPEGPHLLSPPTEGTLSGAGITFDLPPGWEAQPPANPMRIAQASIPGPGGPAEMAVFFFGPGGGGGTEANLERWIAQMQPDPGSEPERQTIQSGPLTIHLVSLTGTVLPSQMGMGPSDPVPGSMLIGAVVEGPGGPWFFKTTGPRATLEAEGEAFQGMLRGIRLE